LEVSASTKTPASWRRAVSIIELADLTDDQFSEISSHLTPGVRDVLTAEGSVGSRHGRGGTAPVRVREQLAELAGVAEQHRAGLD